MAGTVKANVVQLGDSATASQNFVLQTNVDGTGKLARGNAGATTQDILTWDANGRLGTGVAQSMVRLNTANGFGSTNIVIRRFTNIVTNQGTDITYTDSATLGALFTINTAGVYGISYTDSFAGGSDIGISLNTTTPTTGINSTPITERLAQANTSAANVSTNIGGIFYLPAGSLIRPHSDANGTGTRLASFTITKVA